VKIKRLEGNIPVEISTFHERNQGRLISTHLVLEQDNDNDGDDDVYLEQLRYGKGLHIIYSVYVT
jgi:hypothetical protein